MNGCLGVVVMFLGLASSLQIIAFGQPDTFQVPSPQALDAAVDANPVTEAPAIQIPRDSETDQSITPMRRPAVGNNRDSRRSVNQAARNSAARTGTSVFALVNSRKRDMPQFWSDSPAAPLSVVVNDGLIATADVPLGGGARRMKVAANNRALPQDRFILEYQNFADAYTADASQFIVGPASRTIDLHQYTIGFEKTFADGLASIDIRLPFTSQLELATPNFGVEGGRLGNINAKLKIDIMSDDYFCFSVGTGLDAPTGSSVVFQGNGFYYEVANEAVFLQPFLAYEERVDDWYFHAFTSIDVGLNGNSLRPDFIAGPLLGRINDQTLGTLSIGGGRWIFYDPSERLIDGFAVSTELHYTTTLQDSDSVSHILFFQSSTVENLSNRNDHLNLAIGGHLSMGASSLRLGFVQPLRDGDDRVFDQEISVQFNRLF